MINPVFDIVILLAAGLLVGNELTVAVFLHPTLARLPDEVHAPAVRAFAKVFGRTMPFAYGLVLLLCCADTWFHRSGGSAATKLLFASSVLWLCTIVYTIIFLVPINNRIAALDPTVSASFWRADLHRWDRLHEVRVVTLLVALCCLCLGIRLTA